eukprot:SAG22_NODE_4375_length_1288_cov_1.064760_2_plen_83_part_00
MHQQVLQNIAAAAAAAATTAINAHARRTCHHLIRCFRHSPSVCYAGVAFKNQFYPRARLEGSQTVVVESDELTDIASVFQFF